MTSATILHSSIFSTPEPVIPSRQGPHDASISLRERQPSAGSPPERSHRPRTWRTKADFPAIRPPPRAAAERSILPYDEHRLAGLDRVEEIPNCGRVTAQAEPQADAGEWCGLLRLQDLAVVISPPMAAASRRDHPAVGQRPPPACSPAVASARYPGQPCSSRSCAAAARVRACGPGARRSGGLQRPGPEFWLLQIDRKAAARPPPAQ